MIFLVITIASWGPAGWIQDIPYIECLGMDFSWIITIKLRNRSFITWRFFFRNHPWLDGNHPSCIEFFIGCEIYHPVGQVVVLGSLQVMKV